MNTLFMRLALLCILTVAFTVGCGSGSSGTSPFAGYWAGSWQESFNRDRPQTVTLHIDEDGRANGMVGTPGAMSAGLNGTVSPNGHAELTISEINPPPILSKVIGTLYEKSSGAVFGSLVGYSDGAPAWAVAIDLSQNNAH
jgi:hypothetical protein